jgi:hypothetical protein
MARPKRATKKKTRISPTEALRILVPKLSPHRAAKRLTDAVHTKECQLWEGNRLIRPEIAVRYLVIIARADKDGRWQASVEGREETRWLGPFTFEADEVRALLPRAEAEPPSADDAQRPRKRRGSRTQAAIREIAAEKWPGGCDHIELPDIKKVVGPILEKRGMRDPGRDTYSRALGRRDD